KISTGALSDLEKVTKQAYAMVSFFGMSQKVGNVSFYDSSGQSDYGFTKPYSEKTAELIDSEVKKIIEDSYVRAKDVLRNHMNGLRELAELLLEREVIFTEDLERIFGKRKADLLREQRETEEKKKKPKSVEEKVKVRPKRSTGKTAAASSVKSKTGTEADEKTVTEMRAPAKAVKKTQPKDQNNSQEL
ncbi:MAG TPA: hypothetical protein VJ963_14065, partial [Bacteroidales bacterium]|nr:hypothetical protein [Bacteroidales bacterium]